MGTVVDVRTVGVEEEFLVVDAHLDDDRPTAAEVLMLATPLVGEPPGGSLVPELKQQQLEANTSPHKDMTALERELVGWRHRAATAAESAGAVLMASGTSPIPVVPLQVHKPRYDRMAQRFGILAREHLTCGCHVHVAVGSPDECVGVIDRIRIWLPVLLGMTGNSPLWQGEDTDYASYRTQVFGRWPMAGPMGLWHTAERYRQHIDTMIAADVILDLGTVYYDARCSANHPTVEIRVADVCLRADETVLVAALCRGLVETAAREWAAGEPPPDVPVELLRAATWKASRWGLEEDLLEPLTMRPHPAREVVAALVDHVRPALRETGDEELVDERVAELLARGSGAHRQRTVLRETGRLDEVVAMLIRETVSG